VFLEILDLLTAQEISELQRIAAASKFVDGRISAPHSKVKDSLVLADPEALQQSSRMMFEALRRHEEFNNWAFPKSMAPPWLTRYTGGGRYGVHADAAFIPQPGGSQIRSDLSCTIFLASPESYDGGELVTHLGSRTVSIKLPAGGAIIYPSDMLHEVTPVTRGDRLVGLTFIESRIASTANRELLYEINEIAALEGFNMAWESRTRLQRVQSNLLRLWAER
jgi:PKHD-type hydroxylase